MRILERDIVALTLADPTHLTDEAWAAYLKVHYTEIREAEYLRRGLTFNRFTELLTEDDSAGLTAYKSSKSEVQALFPPPTSADVAVVEGLILRPPVKCVVTDLRTK